MSQVGAAVLAAHLGADHAVAVVSHVLDEVVGSGLPVAGPAAARVELGLRLEELDAAADAAVAALSEVVPVLATEWGLGGGVAGDAKGQRLGPPLPAGAPPFGLGPPRRGG